MQQPLFSNVRSLLRAASTRNRPMFVSVSSLSGALRKKRFDAFCKYTSNVELP